MPWPDREGFILGSKNQNFLRKKEISSVDTNLSCGIVKFRENAQNPVMS